MSSRHNGKSICSRRNQCQRAVRKPIQWPLYVLNDLVPQGPWVQDSCGNRFHEMHNSKVDCSEQCMSNVECNQLPPPYTSSSLRGGIPQQRDVDKAILPRGGQVTKFVMGSGLNIASMYLSHSSVFIIEIRQGGLSIMVLGVLTVG